MTMVSTEPFLLSLLSIAIAFFLHTCTEGKKKSIFLLSHFRVSLLSHSSKHIFPFAFPVECLACLSVYEDLMSQSCFINPASPMVPLSCYCPYLLDAVSKVAGEEIVGTLDSDAVFA